jgi:hypothetical protein
MTDKALRAKVVADKLHATELSIDQAMNDAAKLVSEMVSARTELKLGAVIGDEALGRVTEAMRALSEARHAMVAAHGELEVVGRKIGVRTRANQDWIKDSTSAHDTSLREVG